MDSARFILALASLASMGAYSSCDAELINNSSFDLWCGEELCGWEVEAGEVKKVPTWHEKDHGVELVGEEVVLSQLADVTSAEVDCIRFELLADAGSGADLTLEMDFLDDGVPEYSSPILAEDWAFSRYDVTPPAWFERVRFRIRKTGEGRAVLAQLRAVEEDVERCTAAPLELDNRFDGAYCEADSECAGGECNPTVAAPSSEEWADLAPESSCGSCGSDEECGPDQACGAEYAPGEYGYRACVPAGSKALGELCAADAECGTGLCQDSQCAECREDADCEDGESCVDGGQLPAACFGEERKAAGRPCLDGAECASGACVGSGELKLCASDGRTCGSVADCLWAPYDACEAVGAYGGTCQ